MENLDLVGVRFSSAKPPNPTHIAWGSDRGGALVVDGIDRVGATFAERLARGAPRVLAVDAPLGVPVGLARDLVGMVLNGSQVLHQLAASAPSLVDARWAAFAASHAGALRHTEAITHGATSITAPRPPSWRSLGAFARALAPVRNHVNVLPFDTLEFTPGRPLVIEVLPASMLRLLGLPYTLHRAAPVDGGASLTEVTAERYGVIRALPEAVSALGLRLELPAPVANACAQDAAGDALDAVLALLAAHLGARGYWTQAPLTGPNAAKVLVEGWIVRPG
jgi:hypothetical protein